MTKAVWLQNNLVREVYGDTLPDLHPSILAECKTNAPDNVAYGWVYDPNTDTFAEKVQTIEELKNQKKIEANLAFQNRLIDGVEHPSGALKFWSADDVNLTIYQNIAIWANSAIACKISNTIVNQSLENYQGIENNPNPENNGSFYIQWPQGGITLVPREGGSQNLADPGDATKLAATIFEFRNYCQSVYDSHIAAINAAQTIQALEAIDPTLNYPVLIPNP